MTATVFTITGHAVIFTFDPTSAEVDPDAVHRYDVVIVGAGGRHAGRAGVQEPMDAPRF